MPDPFMDWIEKFPWESEEHKKAYLGYCQWRRERGLNCTIANADAAFFIQKQMEWHDYWLDLVSTQVNLLRQEVKRLQGENQELRQLIMQVHSNQKRPVF